MKRIAWIAAALGACGWAAVSLADEVTYFEKDGIRYQKTRQVTQRPINELRYEQRESTVYRDRYTTEMQDSHRVYQVPITEQQWVPGYQRTWNVFAPPVLSYRLMPVTRWETRSEMVRVPVTRRDVVPEKQVQQVPVWNTRYAQEESERTVAIGSTSHGTASVARSDGAGSVPAGGEAPREDSGTTDWRSGLELRR